MSPAAIDLADLGGTISCQARTALLAESGVLLQKLNNVGAQVFKRWETFTMKNWDFQYI